MSEDIQATTVHTCGTARHLVKLNVVFAGVVGLRPAIDLVVTPPAATVVMSALVLDVSNAPAHQQQSSVPDHKSLCRQFLLRQQRPPSILARGSAC